MKQHNQRGFALLVVLWTVALLALMGSWLVGAARDRMVVATDQRIASAMESAADGAAQHAIFMLLKGQWAPDETTRAVRIGNIDVRVLLEDEALKLNPNFASAAELQALLQQLGVNQRQAAALAAAIVDWRTSGGTQTLAAAKDDRAAGIPFGKLAELADVSGMTPDILQRLRPHLTLFAGNDPDPVPKADATNAVRVVGIVTVARGPGRAMFARHVIVRTNARRSGRRYEILMSERDVVTPEPYPVTDPLLLNH